MKMEHCNNRKRLRDDSVADSPKSKIPRVNSDSDIKPPESPLNRVDSDRCELVRVDSDGAVEDSSEVSEIQDDILNILDDNDNVTERDSTMQGLYSVIKSFEEEILAPGPDSVARNLAPESGEMQPNLEYLLEASDDELGLPPTMTTSEEENPEREDSGRVGPEGVDLTGFFGFEDDIHNYEEFGFGNGLLAEYDAVENGSGYVMLDGLFDYAESTDILWRSESLQAM